MTRPFIDAVEIDRIIRGARPSAPRTQVTAALDIIIWGMGGIAFVLALFLVVTK